MNRRVFSYLLKQQETIPNWMEIINWWELLDLMAARKRYGLETGYLISLYHIVIIFQENLCL